MNTLAENYGLHKRVQLEQIGEKHIAIIKRIKSRIILKDAQKIRDQAHAIRTIDASLKVSLLCHPNICSKSLALLKQNNMEVIFKNPK